MTPRKNCRRKSEDLRRALANSKNFTDAETASLNPLPSASKNKVATMIPSSRR